MRLSLALLFALLAVPAQAETFCPITGPTDRLAGVSAEGDLSLSSGDALRLAGIRLPEAPWFEEALALMRAQVGRTVRVVGAVAPDRWGRRAARLGVVPAMGPDEAADDLGEMLVAAGLALVDPAEGDESCRQALLAREEAARSRRLGLWAGDRYTPIPVADLIRLKDRIGRFVLVEGRIHSVGERPQGTYLNFSRDWASDFTIIVPKRIWSRMAERGLDAATLKGRSVRARGVLEDRRGPALTTAEPGVIEVIEEGRGRLAR
jgi:endonuclease YncB( thermonuclease family)